MILFSVFCSGMPAEKDKDVLKAFHLRMDGKVDQAKTLLEGMIAKDSTNAMAYYELARLKHYMLTGAGNVKIEDIISTIGKAVRLEPKNVTYSYYEAIVYFLNSFMAMQRQQQDQVKPRILETCNAFEKVLELKPDYHEAMLYLVDIYGMLPKEMGGDSLKAILYAEKLEKMNPWFGAKARASLLPDSADRVKYWERFLVKDNRNPDLLTELGIGYLFKEDPSNAEQKFREAIKIDPSRNILILDLARYHLYKVMRNQELSKTELPVAKKYLEEYLESIPTPVIPLKAYTNGLLVMIEMNLGNKDQADKLMNETKSLDPYYSRASGIPTLLLFDPPDEVSHHYFSFFSPY